MRLLLLLLCLALLIVTTATALGGTGDQQGSGRPAESQGKSLWSESARRRHQRDAASPGNPAHRHLPGGGGGGRGRGDDHRSAGGGGGGREGGDKRGDDTGGGGGGGASQSGASRRHHSSTAARGGKYGDVHRRKVGRYYTSLGDVLFCLAMALAWTVWLLSSFIKSDLRKYQHESVLVRGHVLHVSVEEDSLGTGIPTYKAIIDYMVPPVSEIPIHPSAGAAASAYSVKGLAVPPQPTPAGSDADGGGASGAATTGKGGAGALAASNLDSRGPDGTCEIQIRKEFETSHLLTEGFANVELLVLPHEPTFSVIKEDFERDFALHQQHQRSFAAAAAAAAASGNNHPMLLRSYTMGGVSTLSANNNTTAHESMIDVMFDDFEWWRSPWFRRLSVAGSGLLVLASVAGGVQVVTRLRPSQRCWGWVMVVVGVPLLLPAAIGIHYGLKKIRRVFESKSTLIVRGAEKLASRPCCSNYEDIMDAGGPCDEEDKPTVASPTRATSSTADGCYFVQVNNKSRKQGRRALHSNPAHGGLSPASASCLPMSPRGGVSSALPTQVELDQESSGADHSTQSTSSVSTVSSVSMHDRSIR